MQEENATSDISCQGNDYHDACTASHALHFFCASALHFDKGQIRYRHNETLSNRARQRFVIFQIGATINLSTIKYERMKTASKRTVSTFGLKIFQVFSRLPRLTLWSGPAKINDF